MKNTPQLWIVIVTAVAMMSVAAGCGSDNPVTDEPEVLENFWDRTMGPEGGIVLALTSNAKGYLFAGTAPSGEIFRSIDDGDTWESVYDNQQTYFICLTVDASDRLLAGTSRLGVLRSANDGKSWSPISDGLPMYTTGYKPVRAMAVKSDGSLFAATSDGVYRSLDDGASWQPASTGLGCNWINCFAIDASGVVYAGTVDSEDPFNYEDACGVYRSSNNGDSWGPANHGLPQSSNIWSIIAYSSNRLMLSTNDGVFLSLDGGSSWELRNNGILTGGRVFILGADSNGNLKAAGSIPIYHSTDDGANWEYIKPGCALFTASCEIKSLHIKRDGQVFVGNDGLGVYRAPNVVSIFERSSTGLAHNYVRSMAVHPSGDIYAVTRDSRVQRSTDNGITWELRDGSIPGVHFPDIHEDDLRSVAIDGDGNIFLASYIDGIYFSDNDGYSWEPANTGTPGSGAICLAIDDTTGYVYSGWRHGVYRSNDQGASWEGVNNGLVCRYTYSLAVRSRDEIFAGSGIFDSDPCGLYRTLDGGSNWEEIDSDLLHSQILTCILVVPGGDMFAGTERKGICSSSDGGITWEPANTGIETAHVLCLTGDSSGRLYAGTENDGVFRSTNGGASWEAVNLGLVEDAVPYLLIAPDGHLLAGSKNHGVFRSKEPVD
jgi:ligand-binding sensor domain-containing protein